MGERDGDKFADKYAHACAYAWAHAYAYACAYAYPHAHAYAYVLAHVYAYFHAHAPAYTYAYAVSIPESKLDCVVCLFWVFYDDSALTKERSMLAKISGHSTHPRFRSLIEIGTR